MRTGGVFSLHDAAIREGTVVVAVVLDRGQGKVRLVVAAFGRAVPVVDDGGVDEGGKEGEAEIVWLAR